MFLLVTSTLWTCVNLYIITRLFQGFGFRGRTAFWCKVGFVGFSFLYLVGRLSERSGLMEQFGGAVTVLGAYWIGVVSISFNVVVLADVFRLPLRFVVRRRLPPEDRPGVWAVLCSPPGRPLTLVVVGAMVSLCAVALWLGHAQPVVNRVSVDGGPALAGRSIRIVQLTDLHLGRLVSAEELGPIVEQVNELDPDFVVITGDVFDETSRSVELALPILAGLRAPHGIFAVTGNHEKYTRSEFFFASMLKVGIRVLRQEWTEVLPGFVIAGIDDAQLLKTDLHMTSEEAMAKALDGVPDRAFTLLLHHRPVAAHTAARLGADFILAGHTHAGQIPPFQIVAAIANEGYFQGLYEVGKAHMYVSAGTGTWGPRMRFPYPSEIVCLDVIGRAASGKFDDSRN